MSLWVVNPSCSPPAELHRPACDCHAEKSSGVLADPTSGDRGWARRWTRVTIPRGTVMARREADCRRRSFEEAHEIMERDERHGARHRTPVVLSLSRKGSCQSQSAHTQRQRGQGVDYLLSGGHTEIMRPGCPVYALGAEGMLTREIKRRSKAHRFGGYIQHYNHWRSASSSRPFKRLPPTADIRSQFSGHSQKHRPPYRYSYRRPIVHCIIYDLL